MLSYYLKKNYKASDWAKELILNIKYMNLAIDYYPFLNFYHAGPKVFLNRLKNSIKKQNLCNLRTPYAPFSI